jgi:hypothetical protein
VKFVDTPARLIGAMCSVVIWVFGFVQERKYVRQRGGEKEVLAHFP